MKRCNKYQDKNILVLGLGRSGVSSAKLLQKLGANVTINDQNVPEDLTEVNELKASGIEVVLGEHPLSLLDETAVMVKNPGIPYSNVLVAKAVEQGIPVITEPELAFQIIDQNLIAVTGTNGKTTTTTLISEMFNQDNKKAYAVGNIGVAISGVAQIAQPTDTLICESSSFQLMGIEDFKPHIAVLTNIYEAHLNYHGSRAEYVKAKMRITENQTADDFLVVNFDNPEWVALAEQTKAQVIPFSMVQVVEKGAYIKDGLIYWQNEAIMSVSEIRLPGSHNVENALAAIAVAKLSGVSTKAIKQVLTTFSGVRHRTQYVIDLNQRHFYNDSKATNIKATQKALSGFNDNVILLAGGLDRGVTFEELMTDFKDKAKGLVVFGETADLLAASAKEFGIAPVIKTKDATTAVKEAYDISAADDVILLSPACASWDQWPSFEARGDAYIDAISKLKEAMKEEN